ncbi:hypothetical protein RCL1_003365 [Eukaryota sp. TZLM3-RCL]
MGKVHGSLSHTGKVKNQTPKVEKADNPKKKTGRAAKRILYTNRFVNVVMGPQGKPLGPNSRARVATAKP